MNTFRFLAGAVLVALLGLGGCASVPDSAPIEATPPRPAPKTVPAAVPQLKFLGEVRLPNRMRFQNTVVGGLSGLDYDTKRDVWYIISDDPGQFSAPRFYTAKMDVASGKLTKVELTGVQLIKRPDGSAFASPPGNDAPDPESIRYDPVTDQLFYTSEGTRRPPRIVQGFVRRMRLDGQFADSIVLPDMFTVTSAARGPRDNLGFEGMALSGDNKRLWLAMEDALLQDGAVSSLRLGGMARISMIDRAARTVTMQHAYRLEPIAQAPFPATDYADNGISEILVYDVQDGLDRLLVLERSYSVGKGNTIRLFLARGKGATNVLNTPSLSNVAVNTMHKTLVLDLGKLNLPRIDNLEGMAWGPRLANGHRTLVMVSDDNFSATQVTQFLAFEVIE